MSKFFPYEKEKSGRYCQQKAKKKTEEKQNQKKELVEDWGEVIRYDMILSTCIHIGAPEKAPDCICVFRRMEEFSRGTMWPKVSEWKCAIQARSHKS